MDKYLIIKAPIGERILTQIIPLTEIRKITYGMWDVNKNLPYLEIHTSDQELKFLYSVNFEFDLLDWINGDEKICFINITDDINA